MYYQLLVKGPPGPPGQVVSADIRPGRPVIGPPGESGLKGSTGSRYFTFMYLLWYDKILNSSASVDYRGEKGEAGESGIPGKKGT